MEDFVAPFNGFVEDRPKAIMVRPDDLPEPPQAEGVPGSNKIAKVHASIGERIPESNDIVRPKGIRLKYEKREEFPHLAFRLDDGESKRVNASRFSSGR